MRLLDAISAVRRSRAGEVYEGVVLRSSDPLLVPWPGTYGVNELGDLARDIPVTWDTDLEAWVRLDPRKLPVGFGDSNFLELELLDHVLGNAAYSAPATVYIALYTTDPTDADTGTEVSTGDWSNYARVAVTNNATNWPAASGTSPATKSNGTIIDFGTATIVTPPTVTHVGIRDAASGGNLLKHGALATAKTINNNDPVSFPVGDIDVTHD